MGGQVFCAYCGSALEDGAAFCGQCGARIESAAGAGSPESDKQRGSQSTTPYFDRPPAAMTIDTARFGPRLGAWVLDGLFSNVLGAVAGGLVAVVLVVLVASGQSDARSIAEENEQEDEVATAAAVGFYLGYLPVWFGYDWISNAVGGGWGKRIAGLRIIDLRTHGKPGAGAGFLRSFISLFSGILYIGYLWSLWDSERRTWHDRASGTTVIQT
jgi:uncharacterized RDD family membrane protein YckC